jgi:hypothetical protein
MIIRHAGRAWLEVRNADDGFNAASGSADGVAVIARWRE